MSRETSNSQPGTPEDVLAVLEGKHSIRIAAHERPDGDAVGSAVALKAILSNAGFDASLIGVEPLTENLRFLINEDDCVSPASGWSDGVDLLFVLDCGAFDRLDGFAAEARGSVSIVNIDHHDSNTRFGDVNWVDTKASSTGEMIFQLATAGGLAINLKAATSLWVALVTDTGRFSYENTTAETLRVAASIAELGVNPADIAKHLYQSYQLKEYRLIERAMSSLSICEGGKVASVSFSERDFEELRCGPEHATEIVNIARDVKGVEVALFFYELPGQGTTKVSVRAYAPRDATQLCGWFGGGGHKRAAGCALMLPLSETKEKVLSRIHEEWYG